MGLFFELRRRNVPRMAALYAVTAWLIMQVAEVMIGLAGLDPLMGRVVLGVLAVGFPLALILAWFYEITPEGLKREKDVALSESITQATGRRMDFVVIAILTAAGQVAAGEESHSAQSSDTEVAAARADLTRR